MCLPLRKLGTPRPGLTPSTRPPALNGTKPSTCQSPTLSIIFSLCRVLCSDVKDIHSALEIAVYSDKSKPELIGKIKIPLLRVHLSLSFYMYILPRIPVYLSHTQLENRLNRGYVLKSKRCVEASQGVLYLKCELAYQPVRAALRTLKPRESKLMEREAPFQRKVGGKFRRPPLNSSHFV